MRNVSIEFSVIDGLGKKGKKISLAGDITGAQTFDDMLGFNQDATISIYADVFREEVRNGMPDDGRIRTDNRFEKSFLDVKPFGKIEYFAKQEVGPAIIDIFEQLIKRSPTRTGIYRAHHVVFHNGTEVADSVGSLRRFVVAINDKGGFKPNDEIRIVNVVPYARSLELKGVRRGTGGKTKGKTYAKGKKGKSKRTGNIIQKPNGAYFLTFRIVRKKYKSLASAMRFNFMPNGANGIYIADGGPGFRNRFQGEESSGRPYLYPSIVIKLAVQGISGGIQ